MFSANAFALKFFFAVAAFAALIYMRPDASVIPVVTAPEEESDPALERGVMMATNADDMPVFGVPFTVAVPVPKDETTLDLGNVDATHQTFSLAGFDALLAVPDPDCPVTFVGESQPLALVELSLNAPCLPTARVIVRQGPLEFAVRTNASGAARFKVPALSREADFMVLHDNTELARTDVVVPDIWRYDRVALNWRGPDALNLHAFDEAANIGGEGHIWRAAPGSLADVAEGRTGFLFEYRDSAEDTPIHAEVFTFPAGDGVFDGSTTMRISNLLQPRNCGRDVDFQVVKVVVGLEPEVTPLSVRMPGCGQLGHVFLLDDDVTTLVREAG